ncbi:hypothetical protein AADZ90_007875 [Aestuariibius sp. 2305UL40-4]|uniref:hypothetical protein n=1 Tax=Aestuariibius violaceus TaxID=3234132 RepID=UPI00345E2107
MSVPWVSVTPAEAAAHPKGRPGLVIYAIALWLAVSGAFDVLALFGPVGSLWFLVFGGLSLVAALGLVLGAPWALVLSVLMCGRYLVASIAELRIFMFVDAVEEQGLALLILAQGIVAVAAAFHLLEGDRPNLIFRHRYRAYSEADE